MIHDVLEFKISYAVKQVLGGRSLKQAADDVNTTAEVLREWISRFAALTPREIREWNLLEEENRRLRLELDWLLEQKSTLADKKNGDCAPAIATSGSSRDRLLAPRLNAQL